MNISPLVNGVRGLTWQDNVKVEEVFNKYKNCLSAMPGVTSVEITPNPCFSGVPIISVAVGTEKNKELLDNLLAKNLEGVSLKVKVRNSVAQ